MRIRIARLSSLVLTCSLALTPAAAQQTERAMNAAVSAHKARKTAFEKLRSTNPREYVRERAAWAEELARIAGEYKTVSQHAGVLGEAVKELMQTADFARRQVGDPRLAIATYKRVAALHQQQYGEAARRSTYDMIVDIEQFDLQDRAAAAAHLRELRSAMPPVRSGHELAGMTAWNRAYVDAEIAWLESRKRFEGVIGEDLLGGLAQGLIYGVGLHLTNGELLDSDVNPGRPPALAPDALAKKLMAVPPSHSMFYRNWGLAVRTDPADFRAWLARNDPGGFLTASLLTLGAIADRGASTGHMDGMLDRLVCTESGKPTSLAIVGREYAKEKRLPLERWMKNMGSGRP